MFPTNLQLITATCLWSYSKGFHFILILSSIGLVSISPNFAVVLPMFFLSSSFILKKKKFSLLYKLFLEYFLSGIICALIILLSNEVLLYIWNKGGISLSYGYNVQMQQSFCNKLITVSKTFLDGILSCFIALLEKCISSQVNYAPAAGVLWYLEAQMLPEFVAYFRLLITAQLILCALLIYICLCPLDPHFSVRISLMQRNLNDFDSWYLL